MNFKTKLSQLFQQLDFTNANVARHSGLDPSLISRYKNGKRTPYIGSSQIKSLCQGIVKLAKEEGKVEALCNYCNFSNCQPHQISSLLENWLSDENSGLKVKLSIHKRYYNKGHYEFHSFSKKMDQLMCAFELTNINLARGMHVDPSLVSRFRTGRRKPTPGHWFPYDFCLYMAQLIIALPPYVRHEGLSSLLEIPLADCTQELNNCLLEWMHTKLNAPPLIPGVPSDLIESARALTTSSKPSKVFRGIEGLRQASKYFLTLLAIQPEPYKLYLYSDQPIEWISDDPDFFNIWQLLMSAILKQKNTICIIHNINRPLPEMLEALEKWIPLYMTGLIEPFFFEKGQENRFHQTMFIAPNICSINAAFVAGTEDQANYLLSTSNSKIDYHYQQFHALLENSKPLLQTFICDPLSHYVKHINNIVVCKGPSSHLLPTFSIATMPDQVFDQIMERAMLDEEEKRFAREYRQNNIKRFQKSLDTGKLSEIVVMPQIKNLDIEAIRIDIPTLNLFYTKEELFQHIRHIIDLLTTYDQYYFFPLHQAPFGDMILSIFGQAQVLAIKSQQPLTIFFFENTLMRQVFTNYITTLSQTIKGDSYQREKVLGQLLEFVD